MDTQQPILPALSAADPEVADRLVSRRQAILRGAGASAAVTAALRVASVPVAVAALARSAFGQSALPTVVVDVLNFALLLEDLEADFYTQGVATTGLIPATDAAIFTTIRDHEVTHVAFLRNALGAAARPKPRFDFTGGRGSGGGPYADVFRNYETFKAVAQAFEDTGVRAYKGQAPNLRPFPDVLTAALTIHSVEARHASEVRRLRGNYTDLEPTFQGWINGRVTDIPGTAGVYFGEDNTVQLGIDLAAIGFPLVALDEVTEAFDEPLTRDQVTAVVLPFLAV